MYQLIFAPLRLDWGHANFYNIDFHNGGSIFESDSLLELTIQNMTIEFDYLYDGFYLF